MAARDRNLFAWQAYVITMSIVSFALLIGIFFLWRSWSDLSTKLTDAQTSLKSTSDQFATEKGKVELMKAMTGHASFTDDEELKARLSTFADDPSMAQVVADYNQAMTLFAPGTKASEKNLSKLPFQLLETIRIRNEQLEANRQQTTALQQELNAVVARETAARQKAETELKQAVADLDQSRLDHAKQLADVNKARQDTIAMYDKYRQQRDQDVLAEQKKNAELQAEKERLLTTNLELREDLNEYEKPDFAAPQGKIVRVASGSTKVWINLGADDGLRTGVSFSVLDESSVNISGAKPKCTVVVTRIVGPHLSEARTVDLDYRNIIVSEDLVYSPAWRRGRKVGFALVGEMDINGDGKDDIDQVRQIIRLAGGQIDAEQTSGGKKGAIDFNTSWLVMGTDLTLPENASDAQRAEQASKLASYSEFIKVGGQFGVQRISLDKLMGYLKTNSADRTVPLGNRIRAEDFKDRTEGSPPVSTGDVSEIFQKRAFPQ